MFIGRSVECARIGRLIAETRAGRVGALVLRGEPGVGKTHLLSWLVREAEGMQIVRTDGIETEREIPFGALLGVFHSVASYLDEIPDRQAAALRGALGLGPPVANSRFLIGGATLSLLAAIAERSPLLVVVDDLQWIDEPSADALLFAARRILADRVAMVFATRNDVSSAEAHHLEELVVEGMGRRELGDLLSAVDDRPRTPAVESVLCEMSGGNPLALEELAHGLDDDELSGRRALPELPAVGRKLETVYAVRLNTLWALTREALLVLAVSGSDTPAGAQRVLAQVMKRDVFV